MAKWRTGSAYKSDDPADSSSASEGWLSWCTAGRECVRSASTDHAGMPVVGLGALNCTYGKAPGQRSCLTRTNGHCFQSTACSALDWREPYRQLQIMRCKCVVQLLW
jgi:hypothetical protein